MHIEINVVENEKTARVASIDLSAATNAGPPRLAQATAAATSQNAGPPRVRIDHPLAAHIGAVFDEVHDGGPAPQFD